MLASDCVTALHFLLSYARTNKLPCRSRNALQVLHSLSSVPCSVFIAELSINLLGIFFSQPSVTKTIAFSFVASENWSKVHVGLRISLNCQRIKRSLATSLGISEGNCHEQPPMRSASPRNTSRVNVSAAEYSQVTRYLAKYFDFLPKSISHHTMMNDSGYLYLGQRLLVSWTVVTCILDSGYLYLGQWLLVSWTGSQSPVVPV